MFPTTVKSFSNASQKPGCLATQMCSGRLGRGPRQETLFLYFFPSRKKIVPFLSSSRIHLKRQAGENENKPFPGRPSTGKAFSTRVWENESLEFSELAPNWPSRQTPSCWTVSSTSGGVWGLCRHSRGFCLTLQTEAPVEMKSPKLSRASQVSGNCLWGPFVSSDTKRIRRKNPHSLIFNYNRTHTGCAQKSVEWIWGCRSGLPQQRRVYPSRSEGTRSYS